MKFVWKCRDCKSEYPEDKEDLPKYINPSGIEGVKCVCGGMLDLCPTMPAPDARDSVASSVIISADNLSTSQGEF